MDPLNETDRSRFFSREHVNALIADLAETLKKSHAETANLLIALLKNDPYQKAPTASANPVCEALFTIQRREAETGRPSLFSELEQNEKTRPRGLRLSFFGQYVYRVLKEWGAAGDLRLLAEMARSARYSRNEVEMSEALTVFLGALKRREQSFSDRMDEIANGRRSASFRPLIEEADCLSKELLDSLRILKTCSEECASSEGHPAGSDHGLGLPISDKITGVISSAEGFLEKVLSIVEVYETVRENEYEQLFAPESRKIGDNVLPVLFIPQPSASSREAYHSFFRMLIPPKIPLQLSFVTRLIHRAESTIKRPNPLWKKTGKTPLDNQVLLFFLTLLKQVRTGRTTLSEIMQKIPLTEGLSALFMRLHLARDLWFQDCAFRELEEALRRKRMKNDYLGIQIETTNCQIMIGHCHMNDLSFRLMGRRG
ncbi:MAG TPA: hypothetical protein PLZ22_10530 [Thermotogota bacterium]|nr:hypothetical protein [Thermotogota bacterium]